MSESSTHPLRLSPPMLIVLLLSWCIIGCNGDEPKPAANATNEIATVQQKDDERCANILNSVFDMVQPDRLGISSEIDSAVTLLNEWHGLCGKPVDASATPAELAADVQRIVPEDYHTDLTASRFLSRDLLHFRNCLLFRKMAYTVIANSDDELNRVVDLFYYVTRNISLPNPGDSIIPLTPYEVCIFGKGTAEDRAAIFAGMLRQINIDAVIIRPASAMPAETEEETADEESESEENDSAPPRNPFLVGVILGDNVHLFDTHLGLPIPSKADVESNSPIVRIPATYSDALGDEAILQELTTDPLRPYPIQSASLKNSEIEVIGDTGLWAQRMQQLQDATSGDRTVLLYDPLEDLPDQTGALSRVAAVKTASWKREELGIWKYPEEMIRQMEALQADPPYINKFGEKRFSLDAPALVVNEQNENNQLDAKFGPPTARTLKTRIQQLLGNYKEAVSSYVTVKLDCIAVLKTQEIPPQIKLMHAWAFDDSSYWIALSQLEQEDAKSAEDSLRNYLNNFRGSTGRWTFPAGDLVAMLLAQQGKTSGAIFFLEKIPPEAPQRPAHEYLLKRWKAIRDAQKKPDAPADDKTKSES
ncbi:MAG: transglutaminase-like domain-containing protein [Planctomycetaceae bacterium]